MRLLRPFSRTEPPPQPVLRYPTILVDDDEFVMGSMPFYLNRMPMIELIGTARNGQEAVDKVRSLHPKIVLMDVRMPRMDGFEAAKLILKEFPETRVVLMSGFDDAGMREECDGCGVHGFVAKLSVPTEFPVLVEGFFNK